MKLETFFRSAYLCASVFSLFLGEWNLIGYLRSFSLNFGGYLSIFGAFLFYLCSQSVGFSPKFHYGLKIVSDHPSSLIENK
jgi:hypothetical protein